MDWSAIRARLRRLLPEPDALAQNRWLRWLGPALHHPRLWHMSRRGIALGAAIGVFFAFLTPVAQIPASATVAVVMRANLPSAVVGTLVTNPVTFAPVNYGAWKLGSLLLGESGGPPTMPPPAPDSNGGLLDWLERAWLGIQQVGKPLVLGLALFACGFGLLVYALVHLLWHLRGRLKRRRRLKARAARNLPA